MEPHGIGLTFPIDGCQQPQEHIEHRLVTVVIAAGKTFVAEIVSFQQKMAEIQTDGIGMIDFVGSLSNGRAAVLIPSQRRFFCFTIRPGGNRKHAFRVVA